MSQGGLLGQKGHLSLYKNVVIITTKIKRCGTSGCSEQMEATEHANEGFSRLTF